MECGGSIYIECPKTGGACKQCKFRLLRKASPFIIQSLNNVIQKQLYYPLIRTAPMVLFYLVLQSGQCQNDDFLEFYGGLPIFHLVNDTSAARYHRRTYLLP